MEASHQNEFGVPKKNLAQARSTRISRETRVKTNEHAARQIAYPHDMRCPFVGWAQGCEATEMDHNHEINSVVSKNNHLYLGGEVCLIFRYFKAFSDEPQYTRLFIQ